MLQAKDFDLWADGYDESVGLSYEEDSYPFAGYKEVLGSIYQIVMEKQHPSILDIGFGTATLTSKLYQHGCTIYGQDFSSRMVELAYEKMPNAKLYQQDFIQGLAQPLCQKQYDYIIATYALHHLTNESKIYFIESLLNLLKDDGKILIGDIAFETQEQLQQCQHTYSADWDDEEFYFVADEFKKVFPNLSFMKISHCAAIITLTK